MDFSNFEVESASNELLKAMISMCEKELKTRNEARRNELIQAVCDAMNLLHKEFPMVGLHVGYQCSECNVDDEVDAMEYFCDNHKMNPKDFYVW